MNEKGKISFNLGLTLALLGTVIAIVGARFNASTTMFAGMIICTGGLVAMGNRLYNRIRERKKEIEKAKGISD